MIAAALLLAATVVSANRDPVPAEQGGKGMGGPHFTVVETQGHNLLVTDNATNTLYYYTIDKDKEIGSDLKLRGSIDLNQVGGNEIKIKKAAK
jgi:hypothetical protein